VNRKTDVEGRSPLSAPHTVAESRLNAGAAKRPCGAQHAFHARHAHCDSRAVTVIVLSTVVRKVSTRDKRMPRIVNPRTFDLA